jgi:hypothetical protein
MKIRAGRTENNRTGRYYQSIPRTFGQQVCQSVLRHPISLLPEGKLFLVEAYPDGPAGNVQFHEGPTRSEYFWLCPRCALIMTITADQSESTVLAPQTHSHLEPVPIGG